MRILIVGAGVAGLTLAALLRRQGTTAVVVDRRGPGDDLGYALALWPHGTRVFHGLGIHDAFVARSEPMRRYVACGARGQVLTASPIPAGISAYGHVGLVPRAQLIGMLRDAGGGTTVREGVTVDALVPHHDRVDVGLSDGTRDTFDLVVGADGIGSRVRGLLLGEVPERDTGWGCLVWWAAADLAEPGEVTERYGVGSFLGTYPCRDRLCVIAGAPAGAFPADRPGARRDRLAALLRAYRLPADAFLDGLPGGEAPRFLWRMADVRAPRWVDGRVALVGDAAAAFLPTAGIGASMALESAAVLADELSRTSARYLPQALRLYERRRRRRVEAAQTQSRRLAQLMFLRSPALSHVRNGALRFTRMEQLVRPLISDLRRPI
jgi:2-polyprenyl-6-methoxyphenol hydroxylase-like FAD-dependent oxidoreductase